MIFSRSEQTEVTPLESKCRLILVNGSHPKKWFVKTTHCDIHHCFPKNVLKNSA